MSECWPLSWLARRVDFTWSDWVLATILAGQEGRLYLEWLSVGHYPGWPGSPADRPLGWAAKHITVISWSNSGSEHQPQNQFRFYLKTCVYQRANKNIQIEEIGTFFSGPCSDLAVPKQTEKSPPTERWGCLESMWFSNSSWTFQNIILQLTTTTYFKLSHRRLTLCITVPQPPPPFHSTNFIQTWKFNIIKKVKITSP